VEVYIHQFLMSALDAYVSVCLVPWTFFLFRNSAGALPPATIVPISGPSRRSLR